MAEKTYDIFLKSDLSDYKGKWVVIGEKGVLAAGYNAKKVYLEAKSKFPGKKMLLVKVPEEETMIF